MVEPLLFALEDFLIIAQARELFKT